MMGSQFTDRETEALSSNEEHGCLLALSSQVSSALPCPSPPLQPSHHHHPPHPPAQREERITFRSSLGGGQVTGKRD